MLCGTVPIYQHWKMGDDLRLSTHRTRIAFWLLMMMQQPSRKADSCAVVLLFVFGEHKGRVFCCFESRRFVWRSDALVALNFAAWSIGCFLIIRSSKSHQLKEYGRKGND